MNNKDAGRGAILGALAGDAAGATLEFLGRKPDPIETEQALMMVGGGIWRTAPGQITDDGELALCLTHALAGTDVFDIEKVAAGYMQWYLSVPFDMGITTSNGLSGGRNRPENRLHEGMWEEASRRNMASQANGSLMRIAPLGVWGSRLSAELLVEAACQDSRLTHPHLACQHSSALYCLAIRHLVLNPGDREGAFRAAREWATRLGSIEVQEWLGLAASNTDPGYYPQSGFVKYAFIHAFRYLKKGTDYRDALFETLLGGGDTDTNACIVGGLIGAARGENAIPAAMRQALFECDTTQGQPRPDFLKTQVQLPLLLDKMVG